MTCKKSFTSVDNSHYYVTDIIIRSKKLDVLISVLPKKELKIVFGTLPFIQKVGMSYMYTFQQGIMKQHRILAPTAKYKITGKSWVINKFNVQLKIMIIHISHWPCNIKTQKVGSHSIFKIQKLTSISKYSRQMSQLKDTGE